MLVKMTSTFCFGARSTINILRSKLYHWAVVAVLILGFISVAMDLNFCQWKINADEDLCLGINGYPPLAVDVSLFIAAAVVLYSWGGVFNYQAGGDNLGF